MPKFTIVDYFGFDLSPRERMRAIKSAGFDGVILLWADYFDADFRDFPEYAAREGLFVENTHAPYRNSDSLWSDGDSGENYTRELIGCVEDCARFSIPTLVMHPINTLAPLPKTNVGLERLERILEIAEKRGVNLAIENQGNHEYIRFVFDKMKSPRLRFCYDSGHERFHAPESDLLADFADRLSALHLHDNDGTCDAHMLPFSGSVGWKRIAKQLHDSHYGGAIALECQNRGFEQITDPIAFLQLALERAKRLASMI